MELWSTGFPAARRGAHLRQQLCSLAQHNLLLLLLLVLLWWWLRVHAPAG
jgi:hypothetical protein